MFYDVVANIAYIILGIIFRFKLIGKENIPLEGNLVLCSNHKSNFDPIVISILFPRKIFWMGKKELFNNKILALILKNLGVFPVSRDEMDISAVKNSLTILKENKILGIFPEGTRVKKMDLNKAKAGAAMLAVRSKSPVLPVYIDTDYKFFKKVNIYVGEPLYLHKDVEGRLTSKEYTEMSKDILKEIYSLKDKREENS